MNKVIKSELIKVIDNCTGKLLGIGLNDSELLKKIENNEKISVCDLLNNNSYASDNMTLKKSKGKAISIRSIKRIFGRKKLNNIICDYKHIEDFLRTFIKDSIYITNGSVIVYGKISSLKIQSLIAKYKRYKVQTEVINDKDNYLIKLKVGNCKTNKIKDGYFAFIDDVKELEEIISDLLVG